MDVLVFASTMAIIDVESVGSLIFFTVGAPVAYSLTIMVACSFLFKPLIDRLLDFGARILGCPVLSDTSSHDVPTIRTIGQIRVRNTDEDEISCQGDTGFQKSRNEHNSVQELDDTSLQELVNRTK